MNLVGQKIQSFVYANLYEFDKIIVTNKQIDTLLLSYDITKFLEYAEVN